MPRRLGRKPSRARCDPARRVFVLADGARFDDLPGALAAAAGVRRIVLVNRPFDVDHGEMTQSMKLKRPTIADHFATTLDAASAPSPLITTAFRSRT